MDVDVDDVTKSITFYLSCLFRGLEHSEKLVDSLIGKPLKDTNGKVIGIISSVSIDYDLVFVKVIDDKILKDIEQE